MQKSTKRLAVAKSLYPLEYNRNNPMEGFNEWNKWIPQELKRQYQKENPKVNMRSGKLLFNVTLVPLKSDMVGSMIGMESAYLQALEQLKGGKS